MKNLFFISLFLSAPFFVLAETEPNNVASQANILGVNASDAGTLGGTDLYDWWKITIPSDGKLTISTVSAVSLELDLYLYDINGTTQIASPWLAGVKDTVRHNSLMPGTYFVRATLWGTGSGSYTISNQFTPANLTNDTEPNNFAIAAINLPVNNTLTGHIGYYGNLITDATDWYKITIPADGKLVVNTISDATLRLQIYLYDQDSITQLAADFYACNIFNDTVKYNNLTPGTYYIKCARNTSCPTAYGAYTISNVFTPANLTNDTEPNNHALTAINLPVNGTLTGHLGYYGNLITDLTDWYKITIPSDGKLVVNIISDPTLLILGYLYDQDSITNIAGSGSPYACNIINNTMTYNNLTPGTYYIKCVAATSCPTAYGAYTISNVFTPANLTNDVEPNNFAIAAINLPVNGALTGHIGYYGNLITDATDWYKITIPADGKLVVNTSSDSTLCFDATLYDQDSVTQLASTGGGYNCAVFIKTFTYNNLTSGTYYIKCINISGYGAYTISNLFTPANLTNDVEPNNFAIAAINLPVNDTLTGHIGYYGNLITDATDWYKITITANGKVVVNTGSDSTVCFDATLYDQDSVTQLVGMGGGYNCAVFIKTFTYNNLTPGTYYIKCTNISGYGAYTISNQFIATPTVGTITHPTCAVATGSVVLNSLPATGTWTINPGSITGTGTSTTISGLVAGTYNFTVTNALGFTSVASANVVINAQPATPSVSNQTTSILTGGTFTVTPSGVPVGTTYTWTAPVYTGGVTGGSAQTIPQSNISGSLTILSGTGTATYTVTPTSGLCVGATFTVTVTVTSSCVSVTIETQPADNSMCATSGNTSFTVGANGTFPFTYQWQYNNGGTWANVLDGTPAGASYTNATTATLGVTGITTAGSPQYRCYITNCSGSSNATSNAATLTVNATPTAPIAGTITQPTCAVATGSAVLSGLPSGNWTINPGSIAGSNTSTTISSLAVGIYNFTVTNAAGCTSVVSANVVINAQPETPTAPTVGTITQPTCTVATGGVVLNYLPATGIWTINPGGITGTGTSSTITGLVAGTYNFTVTNASGCISVASANVVINAQPVTPTAPTVGTITQPTCAVSTGSVVLSGLPAGSWIINPGSITGSITSTTISGLAAGTYTYTVTNASGCISVASANVVINAQPVTPTAPTVGTITQPTCTVATGSVVLSGLPSGAWSINPGSIGGSTTSTTISGLVAGTYNYTVTNEAGCTSVASADVVINAQPATPATPIITLNGNILHSDATNGNQWYDQNGIINGATNQDYTVTIDGDYYVIVTLLGCSSDTSNIINVVLTGIELSENNNTIKVYPNPVSNELIIEIEGNKERVNFEIFNSIGQIVFRGSMLEKTIVQTSSFSPGVYLIKLKNGKTFEFKKIVKE